MKISPITYNIKRSTAVTPGEYKRESVHKREKQLKDNYDNINTSIKSNPDARVSFKKTPFIHKAANFASDNPLVAEALFALLITCGLRPASIMATARNNEDKDKCAYQAAKSVSSGLVGLAMTALVGMAIGATTKIAKSNGVFKMPQELEKKSMAIVNKGVKTLNAAAENIKKNNPELANQISKVTHGGKINFDVFDKKDKNAVSNFYEKVKEIIPREFETVQKAIKEQKIINNYENTCKNVADKIFQPVFMPIKAAVTISSIPFLLDFLGLKTPVKNTKEIKNSKFNSFNGNIFNDKNTHDLFQPFSGAKKHENK